MKIVLLRHGKPEIDMVTKIRATDFRTWVEKYDQVGIEDEPKPSYSTIEMAASCSYVLCSNLPRSLESVKMLGIEKPNLVSHEFRECEIPSANFRSPKFSLKVWAIFFRILQLLGYHSNAESYQAIKVRAQKCTCKLIELSKEHETVLFVGHGTLIWFIHKHLLRTGWSGPDKSARTYWAFGIYRP